MSALYLARIPLRASLRATRGIDVVALSICAIDGTELAVIDFRDPRQDFAEREALAENIMRRLNRESSVLEEIVATSEGRR
jgi:hypothetical protein